MTLTEFLLARLAEDEAIARAVVESHEMYDWDSYVSSAGMYYEPANRFAVDHTPARVLTEVEAKRHVVEYCQIAGDECMDADAWTIAKAILRHLASVYSDHPDFNEAWRA